MSRRRRPRKVVSPPNFEGYKPYGVSEAKDGCVELLYEDYEAIKLVDYQMMNHQEAAELMGVSRSTLARIYEGARRKVAKALVESLEIKAIFGNVVIEKNWFSCADCHAKYTIPRTNFEQKCPICGSTKSIHLNI